MAGHDLGTTAHGRNVMILFVPLEVELYVLVSSIINLPNPTRGGTWLAREFPASGLDVGALVVCFGKAIGCLS